MGQAAYLARERRLSGLTHTIINVSASQEAEGLDLRLFRPWQSVVIVNGVDLEELDQVVAHTPVRRPSLGLGPGDLVLGSVTRFDPIKRVEVGCGKDSGEPGSGSPDTLVVRPRVR